MQIGRLKIDGEGRVFFDGQNIGCITSMDLHQKRNLRHGNIGIQPNGRDLSFVEISTELAAHGLSTSFDFYGEFWPNSFIRNGQWFAEIPDGKKTVVVPLNISAPTPQEPEYDAVVDSY